MTDFVHQSEIRTRYVETDQGGRIYHSNFFVWLDICRTEYFLSKGISYEDLEKSGLYIVVKKVECDYFKPALYNQELTIGIKYVKFSNIKLEFKYQILFGDILIAQAYTKLAFTDDAGKLIKIPKEIKQVFDEKHTTN